MLLAGQRASQTAPRCVEQALEVASSKGVHETGLQACAVPDHVDVPGPEATQVGEMPLTEYPSGQLASQLLPRVVSQPSEYSSLKASQATGSHV